MLTYKAELVGIKVIITEESYTSQASFLDYDKIPVYQEEKADKLEFKGKRVKRRLYRTQLGNVIQADVNGSGEYYEKSSPKCFQLWDRGCCSSSSTGYTVKMKMLDLTIFS